MGSAIIFGKAGTVRRMKSPSGESDKGYENAREFRQRVHFTKDLEGLLSDNPNLSQKKSYGKYANWLLHVLVNPHRDTIETNLTRFEFWNQKSIT